MDKTSNQGPASQQVWCDRDPSLLKGRRFRAYDCILQPFAARATLAAIMKPSLIFYRGELQVRRISTVTQKYFNALPCSFHDVIQKLKIHLI